MMLYLHMRRERFKTYFRLRTNIKNNTLWTDTEHTLFHADWLIGQGVLYWSCRRCLVSKAWLEKRTSTLRKYANTAVVRYRSNNARLSNSGCEGICKQFQKRYSYTDYTYVPWLRYINNKCVREIFLSFLIKNWQN